MQVLGVDHIHVFENDLEAAVKFFSDILGNRWIGPIERTEIDVRTAFSDDGIEIVQPITPHGRMGIAAFLDKYGPGIGSVGWKAADIEATITAFEAKGVKLLGRGTYLTRPDIDIRGATFRPETAHGVLFEMVEYKSTTPMAFASLNWIQEMPWMQPPIKPKSLNSVRMGRFNHVNLFQYDLEASVKFFSHLLGIKYIGPIERPELKIRIALSDAGLHIIQPVGDDRLGISNHMKKQGEGVGSLGFKVPDIEKAISELESKGIRLIGRGAYSENQGIDLKAAVFDPDTAYGIMLELVDYQDMSPPAVANLNWLNKVPWMD